MTEENKIRRLANGAIDTAYYLQRGRKLRSEAAYDGLRSIARRLPKVSRRTREMENPFDVPTAVYRECF